MSEWNLETLKNEFRNSSGFQQIAETISGGESVLWEGCVGSAYALLGANLSESFDRPLVVVVANPGQVERTASDFSFFTDVPIMTFPLLPEGIDEDAEEVFISEDADFGARIRVLKALNDRSRGNVNASQRAPVIVASLAALLQPNPPRNQIVDNSLELKKGVKCDRDALLRWLVDGRFTRTSSVELRGEFSEHGFIVDIFAFDWEYPARIEFWDDEIESIRLFNVVDQRAIRELDSVVITQLRVGGGGNTSFIDYLPNDAIVLMKETDLIVGETTRLVSARSTKGTSVAKFASVSDTVNALYRFPTVHAASISSGIEFVQREVAADFFSVERLQGNLSHVEKVFSELDDEMRVVVACVSEVEARRIAETFRNSNPKNADRMTCVLGALSGGFEWRSGRVIMIGSDQLFSRLISRRSRTGDEKKLRKMVDSFLELSPGDLVVHVDYGIARYLGVEKIKGVVQWEDHLKLEFADNKYVYVPASKIGRIQRYFGVGKDHKVKLSKYNSKTWNAKKDEARKAVWSFAADMLRVQAARDALEGVAFPPDGEWQRDFESGFPYRETEDQLTAIDVVKRDMERRRPMDRLLCGDVGFGKTEVALRAAFKAVEAGYQVAFLAPTTVLTEQHFRSFCDRASGFPVSIASLSRFSSPKEQKDIIEKIKVGKVDIVVGTHRILSKDVEFKKLGLVIVDEEQKFGVVHKEKLKQFCSAVDVLTMTATPIPRTLHLSLLGIRDISNLETPPADRLPVETKVMHFNETVVRAAIIREINRGGQVYYLHNQVFDIEKAAEELKALVPEARIRVGHAQMSAAELEKTMRDFVLKKFDVLVCTTIIESGVDIPNANTIFITKAQRFGLAELHQLRGRVGREKKQAYCYLMIDKNQTLSSASKQRLRAMEEYSRLGAGFQISMKDLEIRGAGNILGTNQSGHLETIGYEMYCDFLDSAVRALKCEPQKFRVDVELNLPGNASLPDEYIRDGRAKIDFYRRFDRISTNADARALLEELRDRFGRPPIEVGRLFALAKIKIAAFTFRVKQVEFVQLEGLLSHGKMLAITFRAPDLMFRLQDILKARGISLQLLEDSSKGYVELPRDLFSVDGVPDVDRILEYVLRLFDVPPGCKDLEELSSEVMLQRAARVVSRDKEEKRQKEEKSGDCRKANDSTAGSKSARDGKAPLRDALKRVRSRK